MKQKKVHFRKFTSRDSLLAQLGEQKTDDQEVVGSNPTGDNF